MINDIVEAFLMDKKKPLIITGSLNSGKSYLFDKITHALDITTIKTKYFIEKEFKILKLAFNDDWDNSIIVSTYNYHTRESKIYSEVFSNEVITKLNEINTPWVGIDEIGFLEASQEKYNNKIIELLEQKSMILVLRKDKNTKLLEQLRNIKDAYYIDLDLYSPDLSCIVMASGFSKRFASNKLLAHVGELTLIELTMQQIPFDLFNEVIVVTRYLEVKEIVDKYPVKCIVHEYPFQSDTIKVGLNNVGEVSGAMFLTADQPLRSKESLINMILSFRNNPTKIVRLAYQDKVGNPVIFPNKYFAQLKVLTNENGGSSVIKKHQNKIVYIDALVEEELIDVDYVKDLEEIKKILEEI